MTEHETVTVGARVRELVGRRLPQGIDVAAVTLDAPLAYVGLDSLSSIDLLLGLEEEFGIVIPDDDLLPENFSTISAIEHTVARILVRPAA